MSLQPGQRLGHYRIDAKIGQGGMGAVYQATDTRLNRSVAVKVLPPEVTADPDRRARFDQEAKLAAAFNHPNIATVHDVGEEGGITFIVMEVVQGDGRYPPDTPPETIPINFAPRSRVPVLMINGRSLQRTARNHDRADVRLPGRT